MTKILAFRLTLSIGLVLAFTITYNLAAGQNQSRPPLPYNELMILSFDEMEELVRRRITESQAHLAREREGQAVESLRSALKTLLSRPDQDNTIGRLIQPLRGALRQLNAYEDSLASLTSEALLSLQNPRLPVELRATQVFLLENMMSELRPRLQEDLEAQRIFTRIRDAQIKVPQDIVHHRRMTGMFSTPDLSLSAKRVLKEALPQEPAQQKKPRQGRTQQSGTDQGPKPKTSKPFQL